MARENAEIVRELYDGWSRGDFRVGLEHFDDDLRFVVEPAVSPTPGEARGVEGMREEWREQLNAWQAYRTGPIEHLLESGDRIVAFNRLHGRGKHSGIDMNSPLRAAVFTFREGRIAELLLTDCDRALAEVGLHD